MDSASIGTPGPDVGGWLKGRIPAVALVALALAATWTGLGNSWSQDDLPVVFANPLLHSLSNIPSLFLSSYWPEPYPPALYRPLASVLLAFQWVLGGGEPVAFRVVSVLLYTASVLAVWHLARRLLPTKVAWAVAALFAVHPVHVEAVAVAVNQSELLVGLIIALATSAWIDRRRAGLPTGGWWAVGMTAAYFAGILTKEHAVVLPALFVALELTVLDDRSPWLARLGEHRQLLLGMVLAVAVALFLREIAMEGDTRGTFTAEALEGLSIGGRALTMLAVVPEWARLLLWPARLQADYSIQEIMPATGFGGPQLLGVVLILLVVVLIVGFRRRAPGASLGLLWMAIALAPVHNVLVPTGLVLAERTLFLASVGVLLTAGVLAVELGSSLTGDRARLVNTATVVGFLAILGMGMTRSASRQRIWHDLPTLWRQTLIDAPLSYRAHHAWAQILVKAGALGEAEQHFRQAIMLHPRGWQIRTDLADKYRLQGLCSPAVDLYLAALLVNPTYAAGRGGLIACQMFLGDYADAAKTARDGVKVGNAAATFSLYASVADSALRVGAPAGTVRLPDPLEQDQDSP